MKMHHSFLMIAGVAALCAPGIAAANVEEPIAPDNVVGDDVIEAEIVSDEELSEQRGGFVVSGMDVRLGAEMQTFMNGELVLHTIVNWDDAGATTTQTASAALNSTSMDALRAGFSSGGPVSMKLGETPVYLANGGQTALMQRTDGAIQNILLNAASNISITQQTNATLSLSGYQGFESNILTSRMMSSIGAGMGAATLGALGR